MSVDKIWVLAEVADGAPITTSLELITQARSLAGTVEAVTWGEDTAAVAGALGEYGVTTVHDVGDLAGSLPGAPVAASIAAAVAAGEGPDVILFPATYDGRDVAGRLSVKLDRPVLTNVVDLVDDGNGLASRHAVFGGSHILSAHFTQDGPQLFVVRAKSFPAETSGGGRQRLWPRLPPTPVPPTRRGSWPVTWRNGSVRSSMRRTSWSQAAGASARRTSTPRSRSWPASCTARPAPAGPSWTQAGCPTRTRWARPARR